MAASKLSPSQRLQLAYILEHMRQAFFQYKAAIARISKQYFAILGHVQREREQQKIQKILEEIKR